jgi:hypothetical protein
MSYYQRDLPHWRPEVAAQAFILDDREWDRAAVGPRSLADPRIAQCVVDALFYGEENLKLYALRAWVIMCNHVRVRIFPNAPLPRITKSSKNYSARGANAILGRIGHFWLEEPYDRWVRTDKELNQIVQYIEGNPVAVDLCDKPEDWRWSSATRPAPQGAETRLV